MRLFNIYESIFFTFVIALCGFAMILSLNETRGVGSTLDQIFTTGLYFFVSGAFFVGLYLIWFKKWEYEDCKN